MKKIVSLNTPLLGSLVFLIILVLCGVPLFFSKQASVLVISDRRSEKKREFIVPNKEFILRYTHSVHKTPVKEFFSIDEDDSLLLTKTEYTSYGVGMPFLPDEGVLKIEKGKFILETNRKFKNLNMAISPIAEHVLIIEDKQYYMTNFFGNESENISLYVKTKK